jgi:hypothetical protein
VTFRYQLVEEFEDLLGAVREVAHEFLQVDDSVTVLVEEFVHHACCLFLELLAEETVHYGVEL